jgi:hypothetical protein
MTVFTYSKRTPGSAALDPVAFRPIFSFPADDPEAAAANENLIQALDYGGEVVIDGRFVERFEVEAADQTRRLFGQTSRSRLKKSASPPRRAMRAFRCRARSRSPHRTTRSSPSWG